jgi:hypothetical protein
MDPLGGAKTRGLEAPTINLVKRRWWAPSEVPELEVRERSPSTL